VQFSRYSEKKLDEMGEEHVAGEGNSPTCIVGYLKKPFLYIIPPSEAPFFPYQIKQQSTAEVVG
jgi:hypothetical protein